MRNTGRRRRFRNRGKRKALRKQALQTWARLKHVDKPKLEFPDYPVIMPFIRRAMPSMIAHEITSVQPMTEEIDFEKLGEELENFFNPDERK